MTRRLLRFLMLCLCVELMAKPDWAIASSTNVLPRADSSAMFELPEQVPCVGAGTLVFADIPRFWQAYDAAQEIGRAHV